MQEALGGHGVVAFPPTKKAQSPTWSWMSTRGTTGAKR